MEKVKKAIIPAAGLGTRFLPITKRQILFRGPLTLRLAGSMKMTAAPRTAAK